MTRLAGPIEQQRARTAGLLAEASAIAADHTLRRDDRRVLPVVLLPANPRPIVAMPTAARDAFLAHVERLLETSFTGAPRDNDLPMSSEERASRVNAGDIGGIRESITLSDEMVAAACATCRGECCTAGGTHAFLRQDSITRVRARLAEAGTDDAGRMLALYSSYLPPRHYRGSCVYHEEIGCALPRDLRSNLCNRYHCGELTQLERVLDERRPAAYVGAADGTRLRRLTRVEQHAGDRCETDSVALLSR
jgi:hypothetical protein